jgi:hypothetical protein
MNDDDQLRQLLTDAVSDIEPDDRIEELRASVRPSPRVVRLIHTRPWFAAAGIVAAVIGVVAFVTSVAGNDPEGISPTGQGGTLGPTATATDTAISPSPSARAQELTVYYLGHGPKGDVLFHETVPAGENPLHTAVSSLMTSPDDPDYRTEWLPGSVISAELKHGVIQVELGAMRARRPAGMSARTATEIVQQAVYTFEAASGHHDARVQFFRHHKRASTVLGVPTGHPLAPGRVADVLSLMNISSPSEGQQIDRGPYVVTGSNNGPEGTVVIRLVRTGATGDETVLTQSGIASGTGDLDRLYPWRVPIDTSTLSPGTYTLVASNDDLSGGTEGLPPATDTRVVVLR